MDNLLRKIMQEVTEQYYILINGLIYAVLQENEIFYIKQFISNNQVLGKLFRTNFDINQNPRFLIQEGKFEIEIQQGRAHYFLNDDEGIEYQGKSKEIKFKGKFINGRYLQTPVVFKPKIIIIQDINSNQQINLSNKNENTQNQNSDQDQGWLKYNQRITQKDLKILHFEQKKWVTSSILDSFCCYLNKQSEAIYFKMNQQDRKQVNRIRFVQSSLISSFGNCTQAYQLLKQEFLEFEEFQYRLDSMYRYVGFIINKNQVHWQFVYLSLVSYKIYEFDPLGGSVSQITMQILISFFQQYLPQKLKQQKFNYMRQNDEYSCGLHVANFMNYMYEYQLDNKIKLKYSEREIKTKLLNMIKL